MSSIKGNAVVFTQGGPTAVINASVTGVAEVLFDASEVLGIWGSLNGIDGISKEDFVDLGAQSHSVLQAIAFTPASQLRTTRHKPTADENASMVKMFEKYNIRYVFGIGGNDTSESLDLINDTAKNKGYDLRLFHIAKTVDCDLMENDHTPGYGSAARYVANAFRGVDLDNECFGGVYVGICMGRNAGFLTAAAALGRTTPESGPHLIYLPERAFDVEAFVKDVAAVYKKYKRCVIAVSEGIEDKNHVPILQVLSQGKLEADSHGNVQLSGTGALGDALVDRIKEHFEKAGISKKLRARGDTLGYIQRSFPEQSPVDREEARECGRFAARVALSGKIDGSIAIQRLSNQPYRVEFKLVPLKAVAGKTRRLPNEFINSAGNNVTEAFLRWGMPLLGELNQFGALDLSKRVPKK